MTANDPGPTPLKLERVIEALKVAHDALQFLSEQVCSGRECKCYVGEAWRKVRDALKEVGEK